VERGHRRAPGGHRQVRLACGRGRGGHLRHRPRPGDLRCWPTQDGVADIGFTSAAFIVDSGKNALGILQIKQ
jgi:hypothetical protein